MNMNSAPTRLKFCQKIKVLQQRQPFSMHSRLKVALTLPWKKVCFDFILPREQMQARISDIKFRIVNLTHGILIKSKINHTLKEYSWE